MQTLCCEPACNKVRPVVFPDFLFKKSVDEDLQDLNFEEKNFLVFFELQSVPPPLNLRKTSVLMLCD